jgi:Uma2 family endonuclease
MAVMTVVEATRTSPPALTELPEHFRPLRVAEFQQLVELGVFDGTRVELVGGVLVEMSPQGALHDAVIRRLNSLFVRAVGEAWEVGVQGPLDVDDISLPEPDLKVLPAGRFTVTYVDEYWVVDLQARCIHVHRQPSADGWGSVVRVTEGPLAAEALPDLVIDVEANLHLDR